MILTTICGLSFFIFGIQAAQMRITNYVSSNSANCFMGLDDSNRAILSLIFDGKTTNTAALMNNVSATNIELSNIYFTGLQYFNGNTGASNCETSFKRIRDIFQGALTILMQANSTAATLIQTNITILMQRIDQINIELKLAATGSASLSSTCQDSTVVSIIKAYYSVIGIFNFITVQYMLAVVTNTMHVTTYRTGSGTKQSTLNFNLNLNEGNCNTTSTNANTTLNNAIQINNVYLSSLNSSIEINVNMTINTANITWTSDSNTAAGLSTEKRKIYYDHAQLILYTMRNFEFSITLNMTYATGNMSLIYRKFVMTRYQNVTIMALKATRFVNYVVNTSYNVPAAQSCSLTTLQNINSIVQNSSTYFQQCSDTARQNLQANSNNIQSAFQQSYNNCTNGINNCKSSSGQKTDDEFKQCLKNNADSDLPPLKQVLQKESKKCDRDGDNEQQCKSCTKNVEDESWSFIKIQINQFCQCSGVDPPEDTQTEPISTTISPSTSVTAIGVTGAVSTVESSTAASSTVTSSAGSTSDSSSTSAGSSVGSTTVSSGTTGVTNSAGSTAGITTDSSGTTGVTNSAGSTAGITTDSSGTTGVTNSAGSTAGITTDSSGTSGVTNSAGSTAGITTDSSGTTGVTNSAGSTAGITTDSSGTTGVTNSAGITTDASGITTPAGSTAGVNTDASGVTSFTTPAGSTDITIPNQSTTNAPITMADSTVPYGTTFVP